MGTPSPKTNASSPLLRASSQPITFTKTELRDCKSSGSRQQKVAVSTSSFIAALNSSYHFRVRELSETVLKESDPCEIRLLARLPPITSQLAVVKSAAPVQHRLGFLSRRRRIDISQPSSLSKVHAHKPLSSKMAKDTKFARVLQATLPPTKTMQACDPHTATLCSSPQVEAGSGQ